MPAGGCSFSCIRKFVFLSGSEDSRKRFIAHAHRALPTCLYRQFSGPFCWTRF
nr:MAG TPA: hypothetical protein [Caudoviricetes sp.]